MRLLGFIKPRKLFTIINTGGGGFYEKFRGTYEYDINIIHKPVAVSGIRSIFSLIVEVGLVNLTLSLS